jgi:hypothetical protein
MGMKWQCIIQEDRVHGDVTVAFGAEEILVLQNAKMLLR